MNQTQQANRIKIAAVVTATPRWVGALLAAEGLALPEAWRWWWVPVSALLSAAMALVEGLAFAYVFNAWRMQRDKAASRLLWLAILSAIVFVIVLAPFIAAQVRSATLEQVLGKGWALWLWSAAVAASTIVIVASVGYAQKDQAPQKAKAQVIIPKTTKCRACKQEMLEKFIKDGLCRLCTRRANGETHSLPINIALPVLDRDEWSCYYCGKELREVGYNERHLDHFIPKSKGGEDTVENIVTSCRDCNLSKSDKMPNEKEVWELKQYLRARSAGQDKKTQILTLAACDNGHEPMKQSDIARILKTSQGYVSSVIREADKERVK